MVLGGRPGYVPELPEPLVKIIFCDHALFSLLFSRLSVPSGFALHQEKFYIVFHNRARLVRLAQEFGPVVCLEGRIGDLVPDNGVEVIEADFPADDSDICMKRHHEMTAVLFSRKADVADDADKPAAGYEDPVNLCPYF